MFNSERKNGKYETLEKTKYYKDGKLHREDGPAVEDLNGSKEWFLNGLRHREDGPAIDNQWRQEWWIYGEYHREDGPAIEDTNGTKEWWLNGKRHRENGPAIESSNGNKEWYINGERHRENGPAIITSIGCKQYCLGGKFIDLYNFEKTIAAKQNKNGKYDEDGDIYHYKNGRLHREDGPAVETAEGGKEWFLNDISFTEDEFNDWKQKRKLERKIKSINKTMYKKHISSSDNAESKNKIT
ncbi:hypothetical protein [Duganella qianjiadongensis]|uniref:hypothetical protein n=1 Tax=Duganella qianjiadongensis TaxID=2692176 RepID=UPI001927A204|nr:hypothetical protein [Duganella qianjiadongensis]